MHDPNPPEHGAADEAQTQLQEAQQALARGDFAAALPLAQRAWLALQGPAKGALCIQSGLALMEAHYRTGDLASTLTLSEEVLPMLRVAARTVDLIQMLRLVSMCAAELSQLPRSLACAQEAHRLAAEHGDAETLSMALNGVACYFDRVGDPWHAERLFREALDLAREKPLSHAHFIALNNLSSTLVEMYRLKRDNLPHEAACKPLERGLAYATEALDVARQRGAPFPLACVLGNLSEILISLGQAQAAEPLLDEGIALCERLGFHALSWRFEYARGEWLLLRGDPQRAAALLNATLEQCKGRAGEHTVLRLHHALARAMALTGDAPQALAHMQQYLAIERGRTMVQLQAQSDLFVTRMEAEQVMAEVRRQQARAQQYEAAALLDPLTGLGNRRFLEQRWPDLLSNAQRADQALNVVMIDIDHFKRVNDRFGHAIGDKVLVELAKVLRQQTRNGDVVVRMGGEEFLLVLVNTQAELAADICERLRLAVQQHDWALVADGLLITASQGVASSPPLDAAQLALRADSALYRAKEGGRNRVVFDDGMATAATQHALLENGAPE
jgi:diguanylate cyclase (GGDEF)-like protein